MFPWRDRSILPIGIDIGTHGVRMLQLRRKADRFDLIAAARTEIMPLDPQAPQTYHDAVVAALRNMMTQHKFSGNVCVSALPPERIACKSLRMPQMPDADVDQALRWEAKDRLGFDLTDGQLAYFRSGEIRRGPDTKEEFLMFAATSEILAGHLQQLTAANLDVLAIDLQPCALYRAVRRMLPQTAGVTAIVELGDNGTQFIITQEDRLVFYKNIEIGDRLLNQAAAEKLGVPITEAAPQLRRCLAQCDPSDPSDPTDTTDSPEAPLELAIFDATRPLIEELAKELDLCLRYYGVTFRGSRPEVICGIGGQSYCPRSLELIASTLGSRIEIIQPLRGMGDLGNYARPDRSTEWSLVTGLSLYAPSAGRAEVAA